MNNKKRSKFSGILFALLVIFGLVFELLISTRIVRALSCSSNRSIQSACNSVNDGNDWGATWLTSSSGSESDYVIATSTSGTMSAYICGAYVEGNEVENYAGEMDATDIRDNSGDKVFWANSSSDQLNRGHANGSRGSISSGWGCIGATIDIDKFKSKAGSPGSYTYNGKTYDLYVLDVWIYRCPVSTHDCGAPGQSTIQLALPKDNETPTPTPTPSQTPPPTPNPNDCKSDDYNLWNCYYEDDTVTFSHSVQRYNGSELLTDEKKIVKGWDPVKIRPTFKHCMTLTSSSNPIPSSSNWQSSDVSLSGEGEGDGKETGSGGSVSNTQCVLTTAEVTDGRTKQGKEVSFCQDFKYDNRIEIHRYVKEHQTREKNVPKYRTETYLECTKDAEGKETCTTRYRQVFDHYDFGPWSATSTSYDPWTEVSRSSTTDNSCIRFFQPYRYELYTDTYSGEVKGEAQIKPTSPTYELDKDCDGKEFSSVDKNNLMEKECFIKSRIDAGINIGSVDDGVAGNSQVGRGAWVKFQDSIKRDDSKKDWGSADSGPERGIENSSLDGTSFEIGINQEPPTTQWVVEGIWPSNGILNVGAKCGDIRDISVSYWTNKTISEVVKDYDANTESVGSLGYAFKNQYNLLKWNENVQWILRSDGMCHLAFRKDPPQQWTGISFDIYHPYNYNSSVGTPTIDNGDELFVGAQGTATVEGEYSGRKNVIDKNENEYQTALPTKAGRYYAVFTLPADTEKDKIQDGLLKETTDTFLRTPDNYDNLCEAIATSSGFKDGITFWDGDEKDKPHCKSNKFKTLSDRNNNIFFNVPDEVGVKICVVTGVNYSDSHQKPDEEMISLGDNKKGVDGSTEGGDVVANKSRSEIMINSDYWRVSPVACETVKAKPKFQTWNAGFYTEGVVKMSIDIKVPDQQFSLAP